MRPIKWPVNLLDFLENLTSTASLLIFGNKMKNSIVRKAVFPVAGLGTRFLPATKAMPKELLPIIDKPIIQYAVEEAIAAGITDLIFVTGKSKRAIEDHFDSNLELEAALKSKGKSDLLELVHNIIPPSVNCIYVRQSEALGLGHAVLCAEPVVGNEPFAVLLADDLILAPELPTSRMVKEFSKAPSTLLMTMEVAPADVSKYGIIRPGRRISKSRTDVEALIEKPTEVDAPSRMASIGRYILEPEIFDVLRDQPPGHGGEIQLADAINTLAQKGHVQAIRMTGQRYDCGSKFGYLEATLDFALANKEYGPRLEAHLRQRLKGL